MRKKQLQAKIKQMKCHPHYSEKTPLFSPKEIIFRSAKRAHVLQISPKAQIFGLIFIIMAACWGIYSYHFYARSGTIIHRKDQELVMAKDAYVNLIADFMALHQNVDQILNASRNNSQDIEDYKKKATVFEDKIKQITDSSKYIKESNLDQKKNMSEVLLQRDVVISERDELKKQVDKMEDTLREIKNAQLEIFEKLRVISSKEVDKLRDTFNEINIPLKKHGLYFNPLANKKESKGEDEKNSSVTAANLKESQKNILASARLNVPELEHFVKDLQVLCETLKTSIEQAKQTEAQARIRRDETRDALQQAKTLLISFEQLENAEKMLSACAAEEKETAEAAKLIGQINAAYEVQAVFQRFADAEKAAAETKQKLNTKKEMLPQLAAAFVKAGEEEAAARKIRDDGRETFAKISERVANALAVFKKIKSAEKDLKQKQAKLKRAETSAENAKRALAQFEAQEQEWKKQSEALVNADVLLEQWKLKDAKAKNLQTLWQEDAQECEACQQQKKIAEQAERAYQNARNAFVDKQAEFSRKNIAFLDAQAGYIAQRLIPGEPCPVCGSPEHPHPCALAEEHTELTRALIDALAKEVSALEAASSRSATASHSANELLADKTNRLKENLQKLRRQMEDCGLSVPERMVLSDAKALIENWQGRLALECVTLTQNAGTLEAVRESLRNADAQKLKLKNDYETKQQQAAEARTIFVAADEALKALAQQKEFASGQDAQQILANAAAEKNKKDAAYEAANKTLLTAKREKEAAETLIAQFAEALPGQKAERDTRNAVYEKILQEKNIPEQQWQDIAATHRKEEVAALQKKIDSYTQTLVKARTKKETAQKTIGDRPKPELEALQVAAQAAEEKLAAVQTALQKSENLFDKNSSACEALAHSLEENGKAAREYGRIALLHDRLNGKQKDARMDIETFVQRYYLQRILFAANRRFREMSAGQFELRMTGEEQAGQGKNRGLDLMVYSTVTGKEREVRTLSGGESFMAALSLALGMADQIQESSASLNLDVMFIDEGFGSLDEHSRSQAVRVLKQMAGGSRLVGIISHVSELKQEIEDQLLVTKDEYGSHTRWQIS